MKFILLSPCQFSYFWLTVELAMIMDRLYGGVCYAGIDTDPELKYPKVNSNRHKSCEMSKLNVRLKYNINACHIQYFRVLEEWHFRINRVT